MFLLIAKITLETRTWIAVKRCRERDAGCRSDVDGKIPSQTDLEVAVSASVSLEGATMTVGEEEMITY